MRTIKLSALLSTLLLLILANTTASGQTTDSTLSAPASLVDATEKVKTSSEELPHLETDELKKTTEQVEQLRQLYSEGLIAKVELDEGEQALVEATAKLAATQNQVSGSEKLISEIKKAEELAKSQPVKSPQV